jgi:photosystem II stability/assembly factor-like uncharacterized protein/tetratricopeptide (TPR) repeat protein
MFKKHTAMKAASPYKGLAWKYIGPTNISGRCTDVEGISPRGKQYTIWIGSATGGVWKSTNEGTTFEPVFDEMPSASIGDIAIDPKNPDVVWVGTGEANIFRSSNAGCGIFKTTDGGKTWELMGLENTHTIPRIRVHPQNTDIVYVAAGGHEWTANEERGLYKTTDGGKNWAKNWAKVLFIDKYTGVNDLVLDPLNPDAVYCTTWQRMRLKWNDPRTYKDHKNNGIWKSTDGGQTWQKINRGLPLPHHRGRIGIDIAQSNPKVLYAYIDNYEIASKAKPGQKDSYGRPRKDVIKGATVYRTDNGGENWTQVSGLTKRMKKFMERHSATYGWVFAQIRVDPMNENRVYTMGLFLNVSDDGGKTFKILRGMHLDQHGLWIDPNNPDYLLDVQDGGLAISYDRGKNWKIPIKELPLAQFYNVAFDMATPFRVYGSIQDHHSYYGEVDLSRGRDYIRAVEFANTLGAEGSSHAVDSRDYTIYASQFYGILARQKIDSKERKYLLPEPLPDETSLRGQWVAPTILSPHNPDIVYHGMQFVMMSRDKGNTWEKISPDLSYNDPNKQGDISYQTITSISESPKRFGLIYAGTDDGRIWRTMNCGKNWQEIRSGKVPVKWVSRLVASQYELGTVYLTQTGRRDDDFQVYVWKSTDFGKTWDDISGNIPVGPVNVIREDPKDKKKLYVGTDAGVYISKDGGTKWEVLGNLPFAYVHDLAIHPRDYTIIIATHGRGMWVLDAQLIDKPEKDRKGSLARPGVPAKYINILLGDWTAEAGQRFSFVIKFFKEKDAIAGKLSFDMGEAPMSDIQFDGKTLAFKAKFEMGGRVMKIEAQAQIDGNRISGTVSSPMGKAPFKGEKEVKKSKAQMNYEAAKKKYEANADEENTIWFGRRTAYLGKYNDAIQIYTKELETFPDSYKLYRHRGHRYISTRQFAKAIDDFKKAAKLVKGKPLEVEPDGLPNAANIPLSNTQFNIWYHLGLAYYLTGDFKQAVSAYRECLKWCKNDDSLVATTHWLYMTYRRMKKKAKAEKVLAPINEKMTIIEDHDYYQLVLMYKGLKTPEELSNPKNAGEDAAGSGGAARF